MRPKATGTMAVGRLLKNAANRYRNKEAVYCVHTGRRISFLELNERTNRLANGLMDLGLKKGDRVAFLMTNRVEVIETYFAMAKSGIQGVPLNYRLIAKEIAQLMVLTEAKMLIFEDTFAPVADYVRQHVPGVKTYMGVGKEIPEYALDYERFLSNSSPGEPDVDVREEDYYFMNLTSGTTGLPKAYLFTHYNVGSVLNDITALFKISDDDVIMTVFPIYGGVGKAWSSAAICNGARNVIMNFEPQKALELIQSEKVTISNWVAPIAIFALSVPEFDKYDLSSLRGLVFAGATFPVPLQEQVRKRITPTLYEFYGLQETCIIINASPKDKVKNPASQGKVSPWAEVRIVDAAGNDVPTGSTGQVIARALSGVTSYYKDEEQTKNTFINGWCHTGDLGRFDDEGYFYYSGRTKDMIVTGGQNVFSAEVENILVGHPAVADCAVIGLPDQKWGEAITAVIVRKPGVEVTEDEMIGFCKKEMAGFKVPKRIIWEEQIPRNLTGKVMKYVLVEKYSN